MATKDSIRFLASQLTGLGDRFRQVGQQEFTNALQKRYQQLQQMKFNQEKTIQDQQTAVGALNEMANIQGAKDMQNAGDTDPAHLQLYILRAKQQLYNKNPDLASKLPPEMSGLKIPFFNTRPTPSFTTELPQQQPISKQPQSQNSIFGGIMDTYMKPGVDVMSNLLNSNPKLKSFMQNAVNFYGLK